MESETIPGPLGPQAWEAGAPRAVLFPSQYVEALLLVAAERDRQVAKWGQQDHAADVWLAILGEEMGELCEALLETVFDNGPERRALGGLANIRREAVHVAAVSVAFLDWRYRALNGIKGLDDVAFCMGAVWPATVDLSKRLSETRYCDFYGPAARTGDMVGELYAQMGWIALSVARRKSGQRELDQNLRMAASAIAFLTALLRGGKP
jgi:hypothetical protein